MSLDKVSLILGVLLAVYPQSGLAKNATEWQQLSIYQVLTDRFATSNNSSPECYIRGFCGGTWKGVENNLDYIQGMGFEAIWISPVIHNIDGETPAGYAFHGYWGDDPFSINEHFGTEDDLKSLSSALHKRDMSLMVDVVINHLAANQTNNTIDYELFPSPFNTESAFHPPCTIDFGNQTSIEHCWTVANAPPVLADLNSEDSTVMDAMIKSVVSLVNTYDIDGIRLDTARNVPKTHLTEFQNAVGVFVTGEALNQSSVYCRQYQGPLDSVINYPLWYVLGDTFMGRTTFDYLSAEMASEVAMFPDANVWTNFLDNHDQQRFASRDGDDVVRDANAVTFLMFNTGIPVVYYGFEQRFNGSGDPYNREPFWTSGYNTSATLYQHIATLHKVRATAYNLSSKAEYFGTTATVLATSAQYMAFERGPLVVVVSNVGVVGTDEQLAITESQFAEGDVITDLLGTSSVTVGSNGSFNSTAPEGQPRVWILANYTQTMTEAAQNGQNSLAVSLHGDDACSLAVWSVVISLGFVFWESVS